MWIPPSAGLTTRLYRWTSSLFLAALFACAGCANPGPPKPPSLNLPAPVKDLHAERVASDVRLSWTTPTDTTDDIAIKSAISAEVCRDPQPSRSVPTTCTVVLRLAVNPGPSAAVDRLPASLLVDPVQLVSYRVRLFNASGRAANPSNIAFAPAGTAPDPVVNLRSTAASAGSRIEWTPVNAPAAAVLLERSVALTPSQQTPANPSAAQHSSVHRKAQPVPIARLEAAPQGPDPGGTLDLTSQREVTYTYRAWRTRSVVVGGKTLLLRSAESDPLSLTVRDLTPPATPIGLEAILDGASVDLSWEPDSETDLAGYWVDRTESPAPADKPGAEAEDWHHLNQSLLSAPAYRDTLPPGTAHVRYRVLAVDSTGNVSRPSPPVSVSPHAPSAP